MTSDRDRMIKLWAEHLSGTLRDFLSERPSRDAADQIELAGGDRIAAAALRCALFAAEMVDRSHRDPGRN